MGTFRQPIQVGVQPGGPYRDVEAMVDTGATYTWVPGSLLRDLGVEPQWQMPFVMADGRNVQKEMATIVIRVDGRERFTPRIFGDEGTIPLLGAVTLEEMGLGVDPVNRKLIEVPGYLLATSRRRVVQASQPGAEEVCTLTRDDGQHRQADMGQLFAQLAEQRQVDGANEFVFKGESTSLWEDVSLFVDEESECCPFYVYEQIEQADGVVLRVIAPPQPIEGP